MLSLFGDAETVITAIVTGIISVLTAIGGTYAVMKKSGSEGRVKEAEAQAKAEAAKRREEKKERKDSLDECWKLYEDARAENQQLRIDGKLKDRRIRRLERALIQAGIDLPNLSDHDFDNDDPRIVPPGSSPSNRNLPSEMDHDH